MKLILIIIWLMLFVVGLMIGLAIYEVQAAPWLASNPDPAAITQVEVEITFEGITTVVPGIYQIVGPDARLLDLAGRPAGQYKFRVRWADINNWWSDYSDPFEPGKPGKAGLRLVQ